MYKVDLSATDLTTPDARASKDEGDAGAIIPEGILSGNFLLPYVKAVVGPEHHDGVFFEPGFPKGVQQALDLCVDKGGAGEVGTGQVFPLFSILEELEPGLGEFPVHVPGEARGIATVAGLGKGEFELINGVQVHPLLGGIAGDMRKKEAGGEEEGFFPG